MRFIAIGPDATGKTTFCKQFAKKYNLEYVKCSNKESNKYLRTIKLLEKDNVIFDRLYFPDHIVYSRLKNQVLTQKELNTWKKVLKHLKNTIILYIDAPDDVIKDRLNKRGDDYVTFEEIKEIRTNYKKILSKLEIPVFKILNINNKYKLMGFDITC